MKIKFFAVTKDYFGAEINIDSPFTSIKDLKKELTKIKPEAESIINSCRFAVDLDFIDELFDLAKTNEIIIIPPSSGG